VESRIVQYLAFLKTRRYREISPLEFETLETEESLRRPPDGAAWKKISPPYHYGVAWSCSWFRASFTVPAGTAYPLFLRVRPNADTLAFIDGKPAGAFNPFHKKIKAPGGGEHSLHLEAYAGHPYPGCHPLREKSIILTLSREIADYPNVFEGGELVERVEPVYSLYYDAACLFDLAKTLDGHSLRKARSLKGLYDALTGVHYASAGKGLEQEAADAALKIAPLLAARNGDTVPEIHLIGHAHIDHAWLWHIGETGRKAARTYINMARLAEEYPEFVFIQTQAAQLEGVKNNYPAIFDAVKEAYRRGNWEPNGGMWVEADCNITGGESLIRQFLVGKAAIREMLGYEGDTLWLPDVFGYAAALPQILAGCGISYFVTSKISWNDTTRFPYDTFIWRGIDGSAVKTHYLSSPLGYNGRVSPGCLSALWERIQHPELQSGAINAVGEGDGGGGTTRGDLEMARRLGNLEGAPRGGWKKVSAALDRIFAASDGWPEWRGELYLELHRGTYTTQARTKAYNRRLEFGLRHAEWLYATAGREGWAAYPREELLANWKLLLTNQFHDIIPGSSIHRVYVEAEETYRAIDASLAELSGKLRRRIAGAGGGVVVFNDLSWERRGPARFPVWALPESGGIPQALAGDDGAVYPLQGYIDLDGVPMEIFCPTLPSLGWVRLFPAEYQETVPAFRYDRNTLTTPFYRVVFDDHGRIASLRDAHPSGLGDRELVAPGGVFNGFISAQDVPVLWEAWDIDADWTNYLTEETRLLSSAVSACGPVCFRLRQIYAIGEASRLTQDIVFYAQERRIDFETRVDWHEKQRLLKVSFDTAIAAAQVRCEVQYGHLLRNTHKNLPSDRAKFEICAHKWICLEEAEGGIALLNDSKYGHDAEGGRMRLTLLRSPLAPDESADQGEQRFCYSLLPFTGAFADSGLVRSGYELNDPSAVVFSPQPGASPAGGLYDRCSLFTISGKGVIAECIKAPESGEAGALVIRLYESLGGRERVSLSFDRELAAVRAVDMLESKGRDLPAAGKELVLDFRGFEIKTLIVKFH
jgi:alpha-mannosidase